MYLASTIGNTQQVSAILFKNRITDDFRRSEMKIVLGGGGGGGGGSHAPRPSLKARLARDVVHAN